MLSYKCCVEVLQAFPTELTSVLSCARSIKAADDLTGAFLNVYELSGNFIVVTTRSGNRHRVAPPAESIVSAG